MIKIIFLLIIGFIFISWIFSLSSGWNELSQKYKTKRCSPSTLLISQTGSFEDSFTIRVLNIGVLEDGFYLSLSSPFNFFSEPLLIPWNHISYSESIDPNSTAKYLIFDLGQPPITSLRLEASIIKKLEENYGESIFSTRLVV